MKGTAIVHVRGLPGQVRRIADDSILRQAEVVVINISVTADCCRLHGEQLDSQGQLIR